MKALLFAILFAIPLPAAVCKGEAPCKACRDCSRCHLCTSGKASCGVCRNQTAEQSRKRDTRRAFLRR